MRALPAARPVIATRVTIMASAISTNAAVQAPAEVIWCRTEGTPRSRCRTGGCCRTRRASDRRSRRSTGRRTAPPRWSPHPRRSGGPGPAAQGDDAERDTGDQPGRLEREVVPGGRDAEHAGRTSHHGRDRTGSSIRRVVHAPRAEVWPRGSEQETRMAASTKCSARGHASTVQSRAPRESGRRWNVRARRLHRGVEAPRSGWSVSSSARGWAYPGTGSPSRTGRRRRRPGRGAARPAPGKPRPGPPGKPRPAGRSGSFATRVAASEVLSESTVPSATIFVPAAGVAVRPSSYVVDDEVWMVRRKPGSR